MNVGPFISKRAEEFKNEVNAHPEWSDDQVAVKLKLAGAKFGPNDRSAFLRNLPLIALEPVTGRLEVTSAEFGVRSDVSSDHPPEAILSWVVRAGARLRSGRHQGDYVMSFEPFEGNMEYFSYYWGNCSFR